jgi:hypothetical protein
VYRKDQKFRKYGGIFEKGELAVQIRQTAVHFCPIGGKAS